MISEFLVVFSAAQGNEELEKYFLERIKSDYGFVWTRNFVKVERTRKG